MGWEGRGAGGGGVYGGDDDDDKHNYNEDGNR